MSTPDQPQQPDVPQQPYGQQPPAAPQYGESAQYAPQRGYNTMSIVAFILAFFVSIVGIILGFIALSQIKKTGEQGRGLALAAVIIGFVEIALGIIFTIVFIALIGSAGVTYQMNS
ncbi:DUF4190 domain-containing protein [Leifsonia poae]|uniref:DUF4190 domain-containing protein n=1 Tax=Leifsonia poae TaxID=110933 RepID=UPI003D66C8D8